MEWDIEKCDMLMRSGKRQISEGIKMPNQEIIRMEKKENYKYLGILGTESVKQVEIREKNFFK